MADASEPFLFTRLIDTLRTAEECCRGLAIAREDTRWLKVAALLGQVNANSKQLAQQSARQALHLLGRELTRQ